MKIFLAITIFCVSTSASALDWKPIAANAFGQGFDVVTTTRFPNSGHCTESNPLAGPHPSTTYLVTTHAAVVALGAIEQWGLETLATHTQGRKATVLRWIGKSFNYALGVTGTHSGIRNLSLCGW